MKQPEMLRQAKNEAEPNADHMKALITDLGNKDGVIRLKASSALLAKKEAAVHPLIGALSNPNEQLRAEAGKLLDELDVAWSSYDNPQTINALIRAIGDTDGMVRVTARQVLVNMRKTAIAPLKEALLSKIERQRWEATKALGQIGDPEATEALIGALEDEMFDVRWLASEGLVAIGHKAIVPLLKALHKKPESLWLREGVHHFLHGIDMGNLGNILLPVRQALEDTDSTLKLPFVIDTALKSLT